MLKSNLFPLAPFQIFDAFDCFLNMIQLERLNEYVASAFRTSSRRRIGNHRLDLQRF